jgi:putative exporter of polyketide antibiotics
MRLAINAIIFQAAWWSAAILNESSLALLFCFSLVLFYTQSDKREALCDLLVVLPLMLGMEALLMFLGLFDYAHGLIPCYIVLLWVCLILTFRVSLAFVFSIQRITACIIVCICAPSSYYAAAQLGALTIHVDVVLFFPIFGFLWAISLFFAEYIASRTYKKYCSARY